MSQQFPQQQPDHPQYQQPQTEPQSQMTPPPQWPPAATKKPRRRWPWIVGIIVAIIVLTVIIGGLFYKNTSSTATFSPANVIDTTVATLDKDGNSDSGKSVHFTATILNFVKDSNGNTAGANVDDPNTSGVIQVGFPDGTDLSHLNTGDTLEVWGVDAGTSSGTNAFGATIQEVGVAAASMTDQTTGYHI